MKRQVSILGAGVIGLSCGVRLAEAGYDVTIYAKDFSPETTSDVSAAIWAPYAVQPVELAQQWGLNTYKVFLSLMDQPEETGVSLLPLREYVIGEVNPPEWALALESFRLLPKDAYPKGYDGGFEVHVPLAEMGLYMPYLMKRFVGAGGRCVERTFTRLDDFIQGDAIHVHCAGLGAGALADDPDVFPIRGQIMRVKGTLPFGIDDDTSEDAPLYIFPRPQTGDIILGGCAQYHDDSLEVDEEMARHIWRGCLRLCPSLEGFEEAQHVVGLRPGRTAIRFERDNTYTQPVYHLYGHGGSGMTLSWGSADALLRMIAGIIDC